VKGMAWRRLRCLCGRRFEWYGPEGEGAFLSRCWAEVHRKPGCRVVEEAAVAWTSGAMTTAARQ
jgi:hypothetical protein